MALGDKYEPNEKSPGKPKQVTKGFPGITHGDISFNKPGHSLAQSNVADPQKTFVRSVVNLQQGVYAMKAWFSDARVMPQELCGAYFVTVKKLP